MSKSKPNSCLGICNNTDGPGEYNAKWNKRKTNIEWFYLYVEPEKKKEQT